jgi:hypothetical protein
MTFSHNEKKILASQIENINNKKNYKEIFKIVYQDNCNYLENDNGIFLNLNTLSDETLLKIKTYLQEIEEHKNIIPTPKEYIPYCSDDNSSDVRLSIQEKNILKKFKNNTKNDSKTFSTVNSNAKTFNLFISD